MAVKFYKCRHCGNVIEKLVDSKVKVVCCIPLSCLSIPPRRLPIWKT
ncbi:MAG: hypothetical protein II221_00135 [Paludibacteraceae bacterium]|nr:hypothetical protein [Paludibacteraceae bacterium]